MACNDVRSHISAVLDRRASAAERAAVAQHLETCAACRAEMRELEAVGAALKALPEPEAPDGYHESFLPRLMMKIDDQDKDEAKEKEKEKEPRKEDSGLLEIRKMASRTISKQMEAVQKSEVEEAVAAVSAVDIPAAVSQPIIVAAPKSEKPRRGWVVPVVAVAGLAVVAVVVFVMLPGTTRQIVRAPAPAGEQPPVPAAFDPSAPPPAAAAASQPTAAAAGPAVAMAPNEATPPKAAAAEPAGDEPKAKGAREPREPAAKAREPKEAKEREAKERKEAKPAKDKEPPAAAAKPGKAEPELPVAPPPKAGKGADALDELLRAGATAKKEEKKAEAGEELPETLTPDQVQKGLNSVKGRVMACHDKYDVDGIAKTQVVIGKNGKVSSVKMIGPFVGTPTGDCVATAIRSASFPRFKGKPLSISYTYLLKR